MSDLPDTPYCRVLPSGHEVHWWDKSGNECLCGVAAKVVGKARGVCPECGALECLLGDPS